jgi:hypothetical protein
MAKRLEREKKTAAKAGKLNGTKAANGPDTKTSGSDAKPAQSGNVTQRIMRASVEEADDE